MPDYIVIEDLLVRAILGINPEERVNRQDVVINVRLEACTRAAALSDNIDDAVNYRTLSKEIIQLAETSGFMLVEKMAEEIAGLCLRREKVQRVWIDVRKPGALRFARSVGVSIERSREDGN
ncbi:MAG: dihydroneopterin aldolase [Planctomycetaceae bacterium]